MRVLVAALLIVPLLAGCLTPYTDYHEFDADSQYENPGVFEGQYHFGDGSTVLQSGLYVPYVYPQVVRLESALPAWEGPLGDREEAKVDIVMAIWRPNTTEQVPIIVDAGPYFEVGQHCKYPGQVPCLEYEDDTIDYQGQTTPFNYRNFVPHGYAVVQLAVRGTGTAGGCMDLMGPSEMHDLDQAITYLGTQEWSNGNIAMVGASYDGSTPWIVAASGNPHLKTIVPTAGLPDIYGLMFHNGSAETRGAIMHNVVYYGYGYSDDFPQRPANWPEDVPWIPPAGIGQANGRSSEQDLHNAACPEVVEGSAMGQASAHNGDRGGAASTYWTERDHRQRVIDNYEGSIFLIHGLQDWNVDPHSAIPFNKELKDAGFEMKEWYGQWGHAFPDSSCADAAPEWVVLPCRLDFAEVLFRWFEYYLKGKTDVDHGPDIQIQDNVGFWRNAESYPPTNADWFELKLSADERLVESGAQSGEVRMLPPGSTGSAGLLPTAANGPGNILRFRSEPLEEELHISGLPQMKIPFEVEGQGGNLAAWLFDEDPRGFVRAVGVGFDQAAKEWYAGGLPIVGHGQMNLRYYDGGEEPQPLLPNTVYEAQFEMEPLEVRIPANHTLSLWVFQYHYPDRTDSTTAAPVIMHLGDSTKLRLPTLDVDAKTVFPVPGAHFSNSSYIPQMYVPYPNVAAPVAKSVDADDERVANKESLVSLW